MSEDNKQERKKNSEFKVPPRTYLLWMVILAAIPLLMFFKNTTDHQGAQITQNQFLEKVRSGNISEGVIVYDPQSPALRQIYGKYYSTEPEFGGKEAVRKKDSNGKEVQIAFSAKDVRLTDQMEDEVLATGKFQPKQPNTMLNWIG
jgi:hypothetical protein